MTGPTLQPYPPPRRHRSGCWLVGLTSSLIAIALIVLAIFLPPINLPDRLLAAQYSPLNAASPAIALDAEFRISLPPDEFPDDYAVKIERLPATEIDSTDNTGVSSHPSLLAARCRARQTLPRAPSPPLRSARRRPSS